MRRNPRTLLTAGLLATTALLGTSACGDAGGDDARATPGINTQTAGTTGPTTPVSSSPTASARMTEGIDQPVVLQRSGGVGGLKDRVEVRPDGTTTVTTKGKAPVTRQLSEAELAAIAQAVQKAGIQQ